ncbi:MAG: hypothetical protein GXP48_10115 [Acidobacteria bacterium]|nr:hypothetical protein [Acidobacteriota bacterium]
MENRLRRLYFWLLAPAIVLFGAAYVAQARHLVDVEPFMRRHPALGPAIFVLAAICGIALPILLRTLFVYENRERKSITEDALFAFERKMLLAAMATPYLAIAAAFLEIPKVLFAGTVLAMLYAVYYFYPSEKRMSFEKRIFRVR